MPRFVQSLWHYARITLLSLLLGSAVMVAYTYIRGGRTVLEYSNSFFWGAVVVILFGGLVAGLGGRGRSTRPKSTSRRRSFQELEREREAQRRQRYEEREQAVNHGIAIAVAALPMLLIAWLLSH